jgi:hypothetical protein
LGAAFARVFLAGFSAATTVAAEATTCCKTGALTGRAAAAVVAVAAVFPLVTLATSGTEATEETETGVEVAFGLLDFAIYILYKHIVFKCFNA